MLGVVLIIEPAPRVGGHIANIAVLRNHAENLTVRSSIVADGANIVARQYRRNGAQKIGLVANGEVVAVGQVIGLSRLVSAGHGRNASWENKHYVLAQLSQVFILTAAETLAQTYQQKQ